MGHHDNFPTSIKHVLLLFSCISFTFGVNQKNDFADSEESVSSNSSSPSSPGITVGATRINKTVLAWATPNATKVPSSPLGISSIYSAAMIFKLVKTYQDRITTNDPVNEVYYTLQRLGDNVWFNIERVAPFKTFVHWALNTSRITDRFGPDGKSLINSYIQNESSSCAPESAFNVPYDVVMSDDANTRVKLNGKINEWFRKNENTPVDKMCNRFRGLQCNPSTRKCECESESHRYNSYHMIEFDPAGKYRDGCYIKAWKSCKHLSLDATIPAEYKAFHAHHANMKRFLFHMATPVPRTSRCEKGTYCIDMVLHQKRPICWCLSRMHSKECYKINGSLPLLPVFLATRKQFHLAMIPEQDRRTKCLVDAKLDEYLQSIEDLMLDPERNYVTIYRLMRDVIGKKGRFCDFRKGLACDPYRKTCSYRTGCGPGRVLEITNGRKVCLVNNGYPCPTIELQCVRGAECKDFGQGRHCHCKSERFGDLCRFEHPTFFGALLQSRVSGFVGYHFVNLQELVNHVLAPAERLMTLSYGKSCNPFLDVHAMNIVRYLGGVRSVTLEQMDMALGAVQYLVGKDEPLCDYRKFLTCSRQAICEPMIPDVIQYELKDTPRYPGRVRVHLSLRHRARCGGSEKYPDVPPIYQDMIHVRCLPHHTCRKVEGRTNSMDKYCLCPIGFEGDACLNKIPRAKRIDIYEVGSSAAELVTNDGFVHDEVNH